MREGIDYIGVGVGAVIVNDKNKILLSKRGKDAKNEKGKWEYPGGSVEFGDTLRDTIKREIKEELGVEIELFEQLPSIDHFIPEENQHWITNAFIARIVKGVPQILEPDKCEEISWFSLEEIKKKQDLSIATKDYIPHIEAILNR